MTITEEIKEQLKRNLVYILGNQESDILTFDTFVEFFIRYGYKNDFLQTIKELSYFDQNVNQSKANFVSWFSPIYKQIINVNDWMLNPSTEVVNAFSLYYKNEKGIVYTYIYHNPFDDDQSKRYFVLFEDGIKYAQSLVEMLKNVLAKFESQKQINDEESPTYIRFADKIALRGQKKTVKVEDHFLNESEIQRFQWIEHLEENPLMF